MEKSTKSMGRASAAGCVSLLTVALAVPALAQVTGTFTGRIVDSGSLVLPGVTITVTNVRTGIVRTTITNSEGQYSVPALQSGLYDVKVDLPGFRTMTRSGVSLAVGSTITLDFALELAAVAENVTVTGQAPLIETTDSELNAVLRTREVENLPLLNRNYTGLVALLPGAKIARVHDVTKNVVGGISVNGSAGRNLNTMVDGGDNRDDTNGGVLMNFTTEGIEEFKLSTHRFSAAEGRTAGGSLTIVTKSGTNEVRGSAFVFARDDAFAANDYFAKRARLAEPPFRRQAFGGSAGGPIMRNRVFYFGAFETMRQDTSLTLSDRAFAELKLLEPLGIARPVRTIPRPTRDYQGTAKVNVQFNDTQSLIARYAQQYVNAENAGTDMINRDLTAPTYDRQHPSYSALGSWTSIINPRTLNQVTAHKNYWSYDKQSDVYPGVERNLAFPTVSVGRSTSPGQDNLVAKAQIKDDFTVQVGAHQLQLGGDFSFYQKDFGATISLGGDGQLTFFDDPSVILGDTVRYPQGLHTPGIVRQYSQASSSVLDARIVAAKQVAAYVQDDWRMSSRLTLNLGLRYDVGINFLNQKELDNSRTYLALRAIGHEFGRLPGTDVNNVSPRVGFAYDLRDGRSVLRGGYGRYYDMNTVVAFWRAIAQMKPAISIVKTLTNTAPGVGELAGYRWGIDPPPTTPARPTELPAGGRTTGQWLDPDFRDTESDQLHVGFSHELAPTLVLSSDYVHSVGRHEYTNHEINPIERNGVSRLAPAFGAVVGDPNILGSVQIRRSDSRSEFDMLTVKLEKVSSRVGYQIRYELSRAMGFYGEVANLGGLPENQDDRFAPGEWGPSHNDERHRIVLYGVFELPYGVQVSPIFQAASARPYTLTTGLDLNRDGVNNDRYIDPATGRAVSINSERGDPIVVMDLRATKFFNAGEDRRLSVFAEFFNLFNTVNFGNNYVGNARSTLFKQPQGLMFGLGAFQAQFGARYIF